MNAVLGVGVCVCMCICVRVRTFKKDDQNGWLWVSSGMSVIARVYVTVRRGEERRGESIRNVCNECVVCV